MNRNRLYVLLSVACTIGFVWLAIVYSEEVNNENVGVCLFKRLTGIPCPSCGSTRSVLLLLKGDGSGAFSQNPFGLIIMTILVISPLWILFDLFMHKATLFHFYTGTERFLSRKRVAITAIFIVLINWVWNIFKGV